jgi:S1-C subfamily serine protease
VQVWGFPNGMPAAANRTKGPEPAVTSGEVAALRRDEAGRLARLDITAAACPGSSGSPVLDSSGEVVAVVWGSLDPYGKFVSAVSAERVAALLTSVPCALRPPAAAPASGGLALSAAPLPTQLSRTPLTSQVPPQPVSPVPRVVICLVVLSALMAALLISRGSIRCGSSTHR